MTRPETLVLDAIDQLVSESLAQPIVDDYSVNRFERCEYCGNQWHGLPSYVEELGHDCPGGWADADALAAWRAMYRAPLATRAAPGGRAGAWEIADAGREMLLTGNLDINAAWRMALLWDGREIVHPDYATGGAHVKLQFSGTQLNCLTDVSWVARRGPLKASQALLYDADTSRDLCQCQLGSITLDPGATLTISNSNPVVTIQPI
jgi:hypothetical protein